METFSEVIAAFGQTGLPVALIAWAVWFVTVRWWPWYSSETRRALDRAIENGKSDALVALAGAIEKLSNVIENQVSK